MRVEVDPGEAHGFHVFALGDYGGAELDACLEACRNARLFVDAGAHIGLFSLAVARARPDIHVVAIEADPAIAAWFGRNLAHNPDLSSRITLVTAAAADRDGTVAFVASSGSDNVGIGHVATAASDTAFDVPSIALGAWLAARHLEADVVKIDVEGGELAVLDGLWQDGSRPKALFIETHGHMFPDPGAFNSRVLTALAGHAYRVDRLARGTWAPAVDAGALGGRAHVRALLD